MQTDQSRFAVLILATAAVQSPNSAHVDEVHVARVVAQEMRVHVHDELIFERIGALIGAPDTVRPIRLAIPVYSVNIAAVVAVRAALDDQGALLGDKPYDLVSDQLTGSQVLTTVLGPVYRRPGHLRAG